MTTNISHLPDRTPRLGSRPATTESVAVGVVSIASPVGAVVTDTGHTFAVDAVNPLAQPVRLRCTLCAWQTTVTGLPAIDVTVRRHAAAHDQADELAELARRHNAIGGGEQ
jgi:hypothetical protein